MPINIIAELVALKMRYFNDTSNEYFFWFKASIPITGKEVSSRATQAVIISVVLVRSVIPVIEIRKRAQNSPFDFNSLLNKFIPHTLIESPETKISDFKKSEYLSIESTLIIDEPDGSL